MTDALPPVPSPQSDVLAPGTAARLQQDLAMIDQTAQPVLLSFGKERKFWRETAVAQDKSRYLGEYLVYLVGRIEALEAEVAALKK